MKHLLNILVVYLLIPGWLWAQPQKPKLDSFEQLRQTVLLQYIGQLATSDTVNLFDKNVYYFYHEVPTHTLDERNMIRSTIKEDTYYTIGYAQKYCNCQSPSDIKALPFRFFKRTHPSLYKIINTDTFFGPAINSTAFFIYCSSKNRRRKEVISVAYFWPAAQIMLISNARPEVH